MGCGLVVVLLLSGCGGGSPTDSTSLGSIDSPRGWFRVRKVDMQPTPEHGVRAERYWTELTTCMSEGFDPRLFKVDLRSGPWFTGHGEVGGEYHLLTGIEVIAEGDVQSWKHEMMHYLLHVKENDLDWDHAHGGLVQYGVDVYGKPVMQGKDWLRCTIH